MLHHAVFHDEGIQKDCLCYLNKFKVISMLFVYILVLHIWNKLFWARK